MLALLADFEAAGGVLALNSEIRGAKQSSGGFALAIDDGGDSFGTRYLVNAAGLHAHEVAKQFENLPLRLVPKVHYARGHYFSLQSTASFQHLVYPVPSSFGLGIHLTVDLAGQVRFGPDVEWVERIDYRVDPRLADRFGGAIRRYWPHLPQNALQPAYSGIRPKLQGPGEPPRDFMLQGKTEHGLPGLVNLFGIDSPGLTSSLALAAQVRRNLLG
jgi:L-2-hydroxyglutarate oxidase LhgO